jgi:hypothetical protein
MFKIKSLFSALDSTPIPSAADIAAVIQRGEDERAAAIAALEEIGRSRHDLLLKDDDPGLDRLDAAEEAHFRVIAKVDAALPELQEKLAAARVRERGDAMRRARERMQGGVEVLRAAVHQALAANLAVEQIFNDARRDLGMGAADQAVPNCRFAGFLTPDGVSYWNAWATRALATPWHPEPARPVPSPPEPLAPPPADPAPGPDGAVEVIIGRNGYRNSSFEVWGPGTRVRLPATGAALLVKSGHAVYAPGAAAPTEAPAIAPAAPGRVMTERPPRPQLPDAPPDGFVRCRVVRGGYCDADGRQCSRDDLVDLPEAIATAAAGNGAVEILPPTKHAADGPPLAETVASPPPSDDARATKRRKP